MRQNASAPVRAEADQCACSIARESRRSDVYNEEAFRQLLAIERHRRERGGRPFLLLLLHLDQHASGRPRIDAMIAAKLFSALCRSLRETDVVGWYEDQRVAGAVLTEVADASPAEAARAIAARVGRALRGALPAEEARRLRVRIEPDVESRAGVFVSSPFGLAISGEISC